MHASAEERRRAERSTESLETMVRDGCKTGRNTRNRILTPSGQSRRTGRFMPLFILSQILKHKEKHNSKSKTAISV